MNDHKGSPNYNLAWANIEVILGHSDGGNAEWSFDWLKTYRERDEVIQAVSDFNATAEVYDLPTFDYDAAETLIDRTGSK